MDFVPILNAIAFLGYFVVSYASVAWLGLPDNAELSAVYQTIVTPAGYAFAIWAIIFLSVFIWVVLQLLPSTRRAYKEWVVEAVGYQFALAWIATSVWTIAFASERMSLSLLAMLCILLPLLVIITRLSTTASSTATTASAADYWRFRFPFEIHGGWIMAATAVNANVVLVAIGASPGRQLVFAYASLIVLTVVAAYFLVWGRRYVIASVLAWASSAIAVELRDPKDLIVSTFTSQDISSVRMASTVVASLILVGIALLALYDCLRHKNGNDHPNNSYVDIVRDASPRK